MLKHAIRIILLAACTLHAIPQAWAQAAANRTLRIGFVSPASQGPTFAAFRQGLSDAGHAEGKTYVLESRFAEGNNDRIPAMIEDVLKRKVDILVVGASIAALAARRSTSTVPVVFAGIIDPVAIGVVPSLARPGGNITGTTFGIGGAGFAGKWVELAREVFPGLQPLAVLWNSHTPPSATVLQEVEVAARSLNVRLEVFDTGTEQKLKAAYEGMRRKGVRALLVTNDPFLFLNGPAIASQAVTMKLPALYFTREIVEAGGLLSYGSSLADSYRRAALYVDRIGRGARPGDLPVDQPTTFELVVNLKAARAIGFTFPRSTIARADRVIE